MYGEKLRKARKDKKMTLVKVAIELNTTHQTISRYENEKLEPNMNMLKELCNLYEVKADYILGTKFG